MMDMYSNMEHKNEGIDEYCDVRDSGRLHNTGELIGKIISGRYYVEQYIYCGGMSEVYSGIRLADNRRVVLKVCRHDRTDYCRSLAREYNILMYINGNYHQSPEVYAHFRDGIYDYLIMEHVQGDTLEKACKHNHYSDMRLTDILIGILRMAGRLHDMSCPICHCDIKPSNIIVTESGEVVLIDYGTAVFTGNMYVDGTCVNCENDMGSGHEQGFGTPYYAAPEQFTEGGSISRGTDIYAAGMLIKWILAYYSDRKMIHKLNKIAERCIKENKMLRYTYMSEVICEIMLLSGMEGDVRILPVQS